MKITLLGASGSIGKQTLNVMEKHPEDFTLVAFSVGNRVNCIDSILRKHKEVKMVYLLKKTKAAYLRKKYPHIKFLTDDMTKLITDVDCEMVVNALVGFVGLLPSIVSIQNNKKLALANKESLVVGGEYINKLLESSDGALYPIDSEHSALWKCLLRNANGFTKLIITASGGAFRNLSLDELKDVKASEALKHPTWKMGNKITIDCATMMNKAFEVVEAYYLFGYLPEAIEIKLHDESHLHSAVLYKNGTYLGEVNKPDMRNPIKFALYEGKIPTKLKKFKSFDELKGLHFHDFDINRYPLVDYAYKIINEGGIVGAVVNAANEVAVNAYLKDRIGYFDIQKIIDYAYSTKDKYKYDELSYRVYAYVDQNVRLDMERFIEECL